MAEAPNAQREGAAFKPGDLFQQRYRIVRALNAGSMGAVYEVVDERTNAPRALKVMHPSLLENADQRARFAQEARVTGAIDSEHIVRTLDAGVEGETPFLVMELLRGEDLGSIVARKRALPATEVLLYLMQVARALARTHAAGIVHRDLKPDNLFVAHRDDGSPCIKILDFGVAKLVTSAQAKKTRALGTPLFMAPEQARGEPTIGPRADLYALAHVAYGLLTGEPYWADEAAREPIVTLLRRILGGAQEPATARAKRRSDVVLPAAFDAWFARATAVDPAARFEAALSQIESLSAIFEERPSIGHATTVPAPEPAGAPARPSALPTVVPTGASATVSAAPIAGSTVVPSATAMMPASDPTRGRTAFMPQPPAAPPAPPAPPAPTAHASPIAPIAPPPARTQPRQGLSPLVIAGALIVVAGVAVAGFFVLRGSETKGSDKSSRANEEDDEKRAPRRSASAPTSVASAPTTQAPQPSAQPTTTCVGLDCEPFPMADPAALDPVALLAPATKLALRIDPTAKLAGLFAHDCAIGGVCDTRRNLRVQVGFSVDGGGGIYVSVQGAQLVADKASSMFPNGGGIVPPKCSFKAVYDEAVANGLPSAGKTSGQYRFDASLKKPMWYFFEKGASIIIDDATCKLMKF